MDTNIAINATKPIIVRTKNITSITYYINNNPIKHNTSNTAPSAIHAKEKKSIGRGLSKTIATAIPIKLKPIDAKRAIIAVSITYYIKLIKYPIT